MDEAADDSGALTEPLVAHVKDLGTGEISLFQGEQEVIFRVPPWPVDWPPPSDPDRSHRPDSRQLNHRPERTSMSSHREAPEISKDPVADSTDLYAFVSPDQPATVTLIANYIPLQAPDGGPNFYEFGDDVLYEIHIDNAGDGGTGHQLPVPVHDGQQHPGLVPLQRRPDHPVDARRRRRRTGTGSRPTR